MDRRDLRPAATLVGGGTIVSLIAGLFHPATESANDHPRVFIEYAGSVHWAAIHFGQFVGMSVVLAGVLVLFMTLDARPGSARWSCLLGGVSAAVAFALYGVLQAVDGVALKHAVNAWSKAPAAEKAARFATAEAVRWIEWGVRSYQSAALGLTFVLLAVAIARAKIGLAAMSLLVALSGLAYFAQAWVLGAEGFSAHNTHATLGSIVLVCVWSGWLVLASRGRDARLSS